MKTHRIPDYAVTLARTAALTLGVLCVCLPNNLQAQTPCPDLGVIATNLLGPAKIIQTPLGNLLVAEVGPPDELNAARVSIVDRNGSRRTLLEGLPSARAFVGDPSGTSGLCLQGRTLYVVNGQGDTTLAGPVQGTEKANPTPASPIFSSVLAVDFPEALETNTPGFTITLADHHTLKNGSTLAVTNVAGQSTTIQLVVDFVDYLPDPRPAFPDNVRHSHPYGIVADDTHLYVIDAGFNNVRKVDIATGTEQTLASFPPTPSPITNGPPVIENVPTSIHWVGGQLLVTTLGGAPFLPGYSKVLQVHPQTGTVDTLIEGLIAAIDATPLAPNSLGGGLLTLEHNLSFPQPGLGRLQTFTIPRSIRATNSACLTTPSSMLIDRKSNRLILSELSTGRLVWLPAPPSLPSGYIYWSEYNGGRIGRANLDGTGKANLVSGLSNPNGPTIDLARGQMYFSASGTMWRANLDGTGQTIVVGSPIGGTPALDLAGGRVYWVNYDGNLRRANLDGSDPQVLITGLTNIPRAPVLDLVGGKIYWATIGSGEIHRANLDGTSQQTVVAGVANSSLIALDVAGGKMYWTVQQANGDIRRANLDGSDQEILVRNQNAPSGIALDINNGHIYWANTGGGDIRQANLDGTQQQTVVTGLSGPAMVALDLTPLRSPDIQAVTQSDGTFTLTWNALMGRAYQVQFMADLTDNSWRNLRGRITATNTTMSATHSTVLNPQQFYRVQLLP